jgi:hypothetical protein
VIDAAYNGDRCHVRRTFTWHNPPRIDSTSAS